jgi:hypothetical protein
LYAVSADWIDLKLKASDVPFGKNTKTVELAAGKVLMLYKFESMVRISRRSPALLVVEHLGSDALLTIHICLSWQHLSELAAVPVRSVQQKSGCRDKHDSSLQELSTAAASAASCRTVF